jgi:hypothetical protein
MLMQRKISQFLASTAPVALGAVAVLVAAAPAYADTTISTGTTVTSTVQTSSAGNVTVAGTGTLTKASGTVVEVNSANTATVNANGTIYAGTATAAVSGSIGIQVDSGVTSTTITNAGTISVLEDYDPGTASSSNVNGSVLLGNVSAVSNRYGIYSAGSFTGSISNTGGITVDGENSAGIEVVGTLTGSISSEGAIAVLGDNSYGIKLSTVTGNVTIGGTLNVIGSNAQGYVQSGDVGGQILIDGAISNGTGYTTTSAVALTLSPALLDTSTPVVEIDGNVANGIVINAPTSSTSSDTNTGSITAYGNNPALQIGGTTDITIGATTTDNGSYALGVDGSITANAYTSGYSAYAVVIGGKGGNVTLTNGMEVYGTVSATTITEGATAILINAGSDVSALWNTGTIKAAVSGSGTLAAGNLYAIQDLSGSLTSITNQGYITVSGSTSGTSAAIDLRDASSAVTITQSYTSTALSDEATDEAATGYNPYNTTEYAGITGNILLGSAGSTVNIESGTVTGNLTATGGSNAITLSDTAKWVGNIDFGTSGTQSLTMNNYAQFIGTLELNDDIGTLTINNSAIFTGTISDGANLSVIVNGGTFGANAATTSTIKSLTVASGATYKAYLDGSSGTASELVATTATFASGSKIGLTVANGLSNVAGTYEVLSATTLSGASNLSSSSLVLPALFTGTLSTTANTISITVARATAAELGLTSAQSAAYNAIINDAANNTYIQKTLLGIYDDATLRGRFNEMLPDYAGGTFDIVTRAARLADKRFEDDSTMFSISDSSAWLEPIVFRGTRAYGDTPGFTTTGGGVSVGYEKVTPVGNVGFQLAWLTGTAKAATYQSVKGNEFELGLFWRKSSGPLYLWAGGNLGRESFDSTRTFYGEYTTTTSTAQTVTNFTYSAAGHWAGWSANVSAGGSYTVPLSEHWALRPRAFVNYDRLQENSYVESGDTPIALTVSGRTDSQTTATTTLTAIWSAGPSSHEGRPFSVEVEGGRRSWLSGNLGTTTATFETGDTFSVNGGHLPSAWVSNISILQGGLDYTWKIGADVERGTDKGLSYGVTASISIAL